MLFSQRYGYKTVKEIIQVDKMDNELRNALWDALCLFYWDLHIFLKERMRVIDLLVNI